MRYVRYAFLATLAIILICLALANRSMVTLKTMPDGLPDPFGLSQSVQLPLFVVIFGGIIAGLMIGFFWEWMREYKHRSEATRKGREVRKLEREVTKLKGEKHEGKDEILALLDTTN
jgi:putative membrane protein